MSDIAQKLAHLLGEKYLVTGDAISERAASHWDPSPMRALALAYPGDTGEVSAILKLCNEAGQPVVVIGGNTGAVQGQPPNQREVVICMDRMNQVEDIDTVNSTITVQAGCLLEVARNTVAEQGRYYPLDYGGRGSATVGGNIASNAGGLNVIRYGMMRNITLGLEAVLADGTVVSSMNRMVKNNTGYDLKQLFIGSEGTLGVVTRVVVKLEETPASTNTALLALESFDLVAELLRRLRRELGSVLTAFEFMDQDHYRAVTGEGKNKAPMASDYKCYVVTETQGTHPEQDARAFEEILSQTMEDGLVVDAIIAQSERERQALWEVRENFEPILANKPYFIFDVSLPIGDMEDYIETVRKHVLQRWPNALCTSLAHVGDNNLHFFIAPRCETVDTDSKEAAARMVYTPLEALGGSISAEHGIGLEKKAYLGLSRTPQELELMRLLKRSMDPNNILAPGRIFDL